MISHDSSADFHDRGGPITARCSCTEIADPDEVVRPAEEQRVLPRMPEPAPSRQRRPRALALTPRREPPPPQPQLERGRVTWPGMQPEMGPQPQMPRPVPGQLAVRPERPPQHAAHDERERRDDDEADAASSSSCPKLTVGTGRGGALVASGGEGCHAGGCEGRHSAPSWAAMTAARSAVRADPS